MPADAIKIMKICDHLQFGAYSICKDKLYVSKSQTVKYFVLDVNTNDANDHQYLPNTNKKISQFIEICSTLITLQIKIYNL